MPEGPHTLELLDPAKFKDPFVTAKGDARAWVELTRLDTLWFNTGSLCNIQCANCYMESGPKKDDLAYLSAAQVTTFLDEIKALALPTREIGFTGGEPFMNKDLPAMLGEVLARGHASLVLTNAMKPLWQMRGALLALKETHGTEKLTLRVSVDHPSEAVHEAERGPNTWAPMAQGVAWLIQPGFHIDTAGPAVPPATAPPPPAAPGPRRCPTSPPPRVMLLSRRGDAQMAHGSTVSTLPQIEQLMTFSPASAMASANGSNKLSFFLMRCSAARRAERGPSPGNFASRAIRCSISVPDANTLPPLKRHLEAGRERQTAGQLLHFFLHTNFGL